MSDDPVACPACQTDLTEADTCQGDITFYSSQIYPAPYAEGHLICPECEEPFYINTIVQDIERG